MRHTAARRRHAMRLMNRRSRGRPQLGRRSTMPHRRRGPATIRCRGARVCIVGNGPSADGKGAEIDAYDFVVRTSVFQRAVKGAGKKLNAWCWNGNPKTCPGLVTAPKGNYETWWSVHASYRTLYKKFLKHARKVAKGHGPVQVMSERLWHELKRTVRCHPSTGLSAIGYALERFKPKVLALYGFDATIRGEPNFRDAHPVVPWRVAKAGHVCGHNLKLEKQLIGALMRDGGWLGKRWGTKVVWPAKPRSVK